MLTLTPVGFWLHAICLLSLRYSSFLMVILQLRVVSQRRERREAIWVQGQPSDIFPLNNFITRFVGNRSVPYVAVWGLAPSRFFKWGSRASQGVAMDFSLTKIVGQVPKFWVWPCFSSSGGGRAPTPSLSVHGACPPVLAYNRYIHFPKRFWSWN